MIEIQIGNADDTERHNKDVDDKSWETIAHGKTHEEALKVLIYKLNDERISMDNSFLRIVEGQIVTTL